MNRRIIGTTGLFLGTIAVLTGLYVIGIASAVLGLAYLLLAGLSALLITRVFCARCPIRETCVHVLPGYVAQLWKEEPGPYTRSQILKTTLFFLILILPPQPFLAEHTSLLLLFWVCLGLAAVFSYTLLCPGCKNRFCPFRRGA